jgi:translation elongation factor EF-Tu-like GTPase
VVVGVEIVVEVEVQVEVALSFVARGLLSCFDEVELVVLAERDKITVTG